LRRLLLLRLMLLLLLLLLLVLPERALSCQSRARHV